MNNLSSWGAKGYFGQFELQVDRLVDNDLGGIRRALFGLDDDYDDLNKLM
nr:MAG TPA: hypothetical protein [Crassvirales sp.]